MLAIWKRELQNYYLTSIGYVFMGIFLLLARPQRFWEISTISSC